MPDITLTQWAFGLVAALGIGFAKAGFGGVMMVVIVIMGILFGILGLFLADPLLAMIKVALERRAEQAEEGKLTEGATNGA